MKRLVVCVGIVSSLLTTVCAPSGSAFAAEPRPEWVELGKSPGDQMIAAYFRDETPACATRAWPNVESVDDWKTKRESYRQELLEMLGLDPLPERTDLKATVTGRVEHEQFTVEKLHFQSRPGLYVTGNLYLPKELDGAGSGDPLRLRPRAGEEGRRQLRQQGRTTSITAPGSPGTATSA